MSSIADARPIALPSTAWLVCLSVAVQAPLAILLGHAYDMPIFMATGYLAASGANPYVALDLSAVFHSPLFAGLTSIGYPPPWALLSALIYRFTYALIPSLTFYNAALKLPAIAATVGLAFLVRDLARKAGAAEADSHKAMVFMLFNPLVLLTSSAWGQLDVMVALLALWSMSLLAGRKWVLSALCLGMAVSLKPIALPLLGLFILEAARQPGAGTRDRWRIACLYGSILAGTLALLCAGPFLAFGWDPTVVIRNWNAHFGVAGGLSWLSVYELFGGVYALAPALRFLGFLWVPAVLAGLLVFRAGEGGLAGLLGRSLRLTLVFFLTLAWLSEPNVVLILPIAVVLAFTGRVSKWRMHALWIIPLVFALFNTSLAQLFTFQFPGIKPFLESLDTHARMARLVCRSLVAFSWVFLGWQIVVTTFPARRERKNAQWEAPPRTVPEERQAVCVSLILPTYNESQNIAEAIDRVEKSLDGIEGCRSELIVVDDDSPDGTARIARQSASKLTNVRVLERGRRKGLACALMAGIAAARGEIVSVMDADLQHPPELLPRLISELEGGSDIAIMSRFVSGSRILDRGPARKAASRLAILLTHLLLPKTRGVRDPISGFFMIRRGVLEGIALKPIGFKTLPEILVRGRYGKVTEVPFTFSSRLRGKSKMQVWEPLRYARVLAYLRKEGSA